MLKPVALLAECSKKVGSGHAVQTWQLTRFLGRTPWRAYLSAETPPDLFRRFGRRAHRLNDFTPRSLEHLGAGLAREGIRSVFLNFLRLSTAQTAALARRGLKVGAVTVSGPVPDRCIFHRRSVADLVLAPEFARLARRPRVHRGPVKNLLIVMGGTDVSGSTVAVIGALAGRFPGMNKHVVQGPNFARPAELRAALKKTSDSSFRLYRDLPSLAPLMRRCDAAFTLGSNTSLELACLGTPMIFMHEAPHELRQARLMARRGCGIFLGTASAINTGRVARAMARMDQAGFRGRCARAGARFVDGRGGERLARDIRRFL